MYLMKKHISTTRKKGIEIIKSEYKETKDCPINQNSLNLIYEDFPCGNTYGSGVYYDEYGDLAMIDITKLINRLTREINDGGSLIKIGKKEKERVENQIWKRVVKNWKRVVKNCKRWEGYTYHTY